MFRTGNQGILEHYQTARQCLAECLGDPLCDLMLMIVLTLASSSVTPTVAPKAQAFSAGPKKDSSMFTASLVTRMLWSLRPEAFPWDTNNGTILRVADMTKKIGTLVEEETSIANGQLEHKGVSNRLLRELGWIKVVQGNRDSPRNSEIMLQDQAALLKRRRELMSLRSDADGFIGSIFRSCDRI